MPKDTYKEIYRANMPNDDAAAAASVRDKKDPMVKTFMKFLDDENDEMARVKEDFAAPAASTANTPGMGNVVAPTSTTKGSGDKFSTDDDEDENDIIMKSFQKFLKKSKMNNG